MTPSSISSIPESQAGAAQRGLQFGGIETFHGVERGGVYRFSRLGCDNAHGRRDDS
jgi:hypothetical protein